MNVNRELIDHYQRLFDQHGDSFQAAQHSSPESQDQRFSILSEHISSTDSVGDIGSGTSMLLDYLVSKKNFNGRYLGLELTQSLSDCASEKYKERVESQFICGDAREEDLYQQKDWYLCSGTFNNKFKGNESFFFEVINNMYKFANKGIAFNALSTYVDYQDESLFYIDPLTVFDYCKKNLGQKIVLRNDYTLGKVNFPYEYSVIVLK